MCVTIAFSLNASTRISSHFVEVVIVSPDLVMFHLLGHPRVRRLAFHLVALRIIITTHFQILDPHLLDSTFLWAFNVSRTVQTKKPTYPTSSHPTPPIGRTRHARSKVTIPSMPIYIIYSANDPNPLTRQLGFYSPTYRFTSVCLAQTCTWTRIDMWPRAHFLEFNIFINSVVIAPDRECRGSLVFFVLHSHSPYNHFMIIKCH